MTRKIYSIDAFYGIDQSRPENGTPSGYTHDACNMDTSLGALRVAKGYTKYIDAPVPGNGTITRLTRFSNTSGTQVIVTAGNTVYAYKDGAWSAVYEYEGEQVSGKFSFIHAGINSTDHLIIACEGRQLVKYDGNTASLFGSNAAVSDKHVCYGAMYKSRLFTAGDPDHPNRLYWSQLPGDERSIENWSSAESSANVEGGHTQIGDTGADPITAIAAVSNQLVIFKRASIFRLLGDKPSNFIVEEVDRHTQEMAHTSAVSVADVLFYMTKAGVHSYNGVSAQPVQNARAVMNILRGSDVSSCRAQRTQDKLYFSVKSGGEDALIEYDLVRGVYMKRAGFTIADIAAWDGRLCLINGARYVYLFDSGDSYDGVNVDAWWKTPVTDLYDKSSIKAMRELFMRGSTQSGASLCTDVTVGTNTQTYRLRLPANVTDVLEMPLKNEGRTFGLKFYNESGSRFCIDAGVELAFEERRRVE